MTENFETKILSKKGPPQVFLIPFAGGNCYSFQAFQPFLLNFDVVSLELPGRGKRIKESLITDFEKAADDICLQILQRLNTDQFLLFGHSLGAQLAYKVTSLLEEQNRTPICAILSGSSSPCKRVNKKRYLLPKLEFIEQLKLLGGIPDELFKNKDLFNFFEPIIRADFQVSEESNLSILPPIKIPIYAIMGDEEKGSDEIELWAKYTMADFKYRILTGGHFFIRKHPDKISSIIKDCCKQFSFN